MNNKAVQTKDIDYKLMRSKVNSDISMARWWRELSLEKQHDFAKQIAENEYDAEVQIADEFGRTPEPIEKKIERFISKQDSLAKKYPL